jgi:hypothetical protein
MKYVITLFIVALTAISAFGQSTPPTLRIVTNDPNLPSDLYYGDLKVKPLRLRPGTNTPITIDDNDFFVQQHYIDFLGRMPDAPGFAGWMNVMANCGTTIAQPCDRIEVSSDFFRSAEFQQRGYFIYRFYKVLPDATDPNNPQFGHIPHYAEFMPDLKRVSGFLSDQQLEAAKVAFIADFMSRALFQNKYGSITDPTAYVKALEQTAGLTVSNESALISGLQNGTETRATVLRKIIESSEYYQKFYNEAFVIMQYFGYLRRDADASYVNWIQTMNNTNGDYRTMINGFVNSLEYRNRF